MQIVIEYIHYSLHMQYILCTKYRALNRLANYKFITTMLIKYYFYAIVAYEQHYYTELFTE